MKIKFIKGENKNNKITYLEDIKKTKSYFGIGFDIHKLIKGKSLYLGGIKIPFHSGLQGHSDGDVILHAITDALLGALRQKDIGTYFPSDKKKFKNIRSPKMLKPIIDKLYSKNFFINNVDINLICQKPKVSKHRNKIIKSLSALLNLDMKKTINIIVLMLLISFSSNAQNSYQIKRATSFSEYATTQLKLSNEDKKFLYDTYLAKLVAQREKIHGKELSDEEKKQIYKASRNELIKTLNTRFNAEKTKAIMAAVREIREKKG